MGATVPDRGCLVSANHATFFPSMDCSGARGLGAGEWYHRCSKLRFAAVAGCIMVSSTGAGVRCCGVWGRSLPKGSAVVVTSPGLVAVITAYAAAGLMACFPAVVLYAFEWGDVYSDLL